MALIGTCSKHALNNILSGDTSSNLEDKRAQVKWKKSLRKLAQVVLATSGDRGCSGEEGVNLRINVVQTGFWQHHFCLPKILWEQCRSYDFML